MRTSDLVRPDSTTAKAWDQFVAACPASSLLQTTQWGELKAGFGWTWDLVTVGDPAAPTTGALVLYRRLPLGLGTIAYVPRGPLVDWDASDQVSRVLLAVHTAARRRRAWACWLEPEVLVDDEAEVVARLRAGGYVPSSHPVQPRRTIWVDLEPDEDAILMAMKSKTRYNIRLAERKGVVVREGGAEDIATFHRLMEDTGERDEFGIHTEAYYRRAFELFSPQGQLALLLAEYEGEPLAGVMVYAVGARSWYISGASSNRHRELMPTYAVQWAAIRWARARGCTVYDLWGVPDEDEAALEAAFTERSDGLWGVYRFKRGFGGQVVRYVGLWERALHPLYGLVRRVYRNLG